MRADFSLEWLHTELDRCRDLIAGRSPTSTWTKPSTSGRTERVTAIDLEIERLLTKAIFERLPDAAVLSEESQPDPAALERETCFVIDPIDGTDELIAGRPGFAISIALFHRQEPVAALLDLPAQDRRFECTSAGGTYLNGESVRLSKAETVNEARLAVSATQYGMEPLRPFWASVGAAALVPTPAFTPKFAAVLSGDCDAALYLPVRPHPTAIWDYAAAALLLAEAGGWFGSTNGADLLQQRPFAYCGGWVASPRGLREQLLDLAGRVPAST